MSMIKIENLTFCYPNGSENVFENLDATIDSDWKLGLTGRNGRGKTTLLKLLLGKYEYNGSIKSSVRFDYFPYAVKDKSKTVSEIIGDVCPNCEEWEFIRELSYLDVSADALYMPFEYLSGGEQTKILLAALFLNEGHFLLIDEPTNHLDASARAQVAKYLNRKKGFILVSHDRDFLDGCVDHIMSLNRANIEIRSGNFTSWLNDFEDRQLAEQEQNTKLQKEIKRLKQSAAQSANWARKTENKKKGGGPVDRGYIGHKAAKMMKHSKIIEDRQQRLIQEKVSLLQNTEMSDKLAIYALEYRQKVLMSVKDLCVRYDGVCVNKPVSFTVEKGGRTALSGGNGSGKSSLVKLFSGQNIDYTGEISLGNDLVISYVPQDVSGLSGKVADLLQTYNIDISRFMSVMFKMGVAEYLLDRDMSELSEGQKKKVLIAKSLCEKAHIYIWDEPLNYIDVYCRIQIERLIKEFNPTMIFIEHDKAFRDSVATQIIEL